MNYIEIDQSIKIDDTNGDTILAYSNEKYYSILISNSVKREVFKELYGKQKNKVIFKIKLFCSGLFYLLKDMIKEDVIITIDNEFSGRENDVKGILLNLIWKINPKFDKRDLRIKEIGKKSRAHEIAKKVHNKEIKSDRIISKKELLSHI
ncbi:hypothetical protein HYX02_05805 [Candidatus Woesearchaeota archaeon]|nr:hypothetical protein [Candidatus Woesearchaeota archaeon]